jgi:aryl-alcohol dehydrogenase-like predicted oxidoreductase
MSMNLTRPLGPTDLLVSPLALGGNVFGWTADRDQSFAVLDAYVGAGGNFVDTADVYSEWVPGNTGGDSELILGEWLAARGNRDQVLIATKVGKLSTARGLAPDTIRRACDDSLRRLQTDYLDLFYAHEDDPSVPIAESLGAFGELIAAGKVRHIAASNLTAERLRESLETAKANDLPMYVATQDNYSLMERAAFEQGTAPVAAEFGIGVFPYYSLARGYLTGKYAPGITIDSPRAKGAVAYVGTRGDAVLTVLAEVAKAHGVRQATVALAWLLAKPGVVAPLASARTLDQLADLLAVGDVVLSADEVAALDAASA